MKPIDVMHKGRACPRCVISKTTRDLPGRGPALVRTSSTCRKYGVVGDWPCSLADYAICKTLGSEALVADRLKAVGYKARKRWALQRCNNCLYWPAGGGGHDVACVVIMTHTSPWCYCCEWSPQEEPAGMAGESIALSRPSPEKPRSCSTCEHYPVDPAVPCSHMDNIRWATERRCWSPRGRDWRPCSTCSQRPARGKACLLAATWDKTGECGCWWWEDRPCSKCKHCPVDPAVICWHEDRFEWDDACRQWHPRWQPCATCVQRPGIDKKCALAGRDAAGEIGCWSAGIDHGRHGDTVSRP